IFQFTASGTGDMVVSQIPALGSHLKNVLTVFQATSGGSPVQIRLDDDPLGNGFSRVQFPVTSGQTYFVQAAGRGKSIGGYELRLKLLTPALDHLSVVPFSDPTSQSAEDLVKALFAADGGIALVPGSVSYAGAAASSGAFSGGANIVGI